MERYSRGWPCRDKKDDLQLTDEKTGNKKERIISKSALQRVQDRDCRFQILF
jgi:hypothetical protein